MTAPPVDAGQIGGSDPSDPEPDVAVSRVRLDVAYDGAQFAGWALQPGRRTVQGVLADALATQLRVAQVALTVAGRTDAGVHARGQVAHADLPALPDLRRMAGLLPPDVRLHAATVVSAGFDARFSALWRRYEYRLSDRPGGGDPLRRGFVLDRRRSLDVALMAGAARGLLGEHDFAAYCHRREGASTIRTLQSCTVERTGERSGAEIVCTVQADAFCHSMVRSLVGALVAVGEGRRAVSWPAGLLRRTSRADEVGVAAAHGLTLVEVGYPPDDELADRALVTRARRG